MWPPIRPTRKQEADSRGIAGSSVTPFPAPSAVSVVGPCGSLPVSGLTDRSRLGMIGTGSIFSATNTSAGNLVEPQAFL